MKRFAYLNRVDQFTRKIKERLDGDDDVERMLTLWQQHDDELEDWLGGVTRNADPRLVFNLTGPIVTSESDKHPIFDAHQYTRIKGRLTTASTSGSVVAVVQVNGSTVTTVTITATNTTFSGSCNFSVKEDDDVTCEVTSAGTGAVGLVVVAQ